MLDTNFSENFKKILISDIINFLSQILIQNQKKTLKNRTWFSRRSSALIRWFMFEQWEKQSKYSLTKKHRKMTKSETDTEIETRDFWCRINSSRQSSRNHERHENYKKHHSVTWFSDNHKQTASLWFWVRIRNNAQTMKDSTNADKW